MCNFIPSFYTSIILNIPILVISLLLKDIWREHGGARRHYGGAARISFSQPKYHNMGLLIPASHD